jgi:hypothetical protein
MHVKTKREVPESRDVEKEPVRVDQIETGVTSF